MVPVDGHRGPHVRQLGRERQQRPPAATTADARDRSRRHTPAGARRQLDRPGPSRAAAPARSARRAHRHRRGPAGLGRHRGLPRWPLSRWCSCWPYRPADGHPAAPGHRRRPPVARCLARRPGRRRGVQRLRSGPHAVNRRGQPSRRRGRRSADRHGELAGGPLRAQRRVARRQHRHRAHPGGTRQGSRCRRPAHARPLPVRHHAGQPGRGLDRRRQHRRAEVAGARRLHPRGRDPRRAVPRTAGGTTWSATPASATRSARPEAQRLLRCRA